MSQRPSPLANILTLVIATVAEFVGLFFWVQAVDNGQQALGIAIIIIGLQVERIAVYIGIRSTWGDNPPHPNILGNLVGSGLGEAVAWLIWLYVADTIDPIFAAIFLTMMILFEHSFQIGYFRRGKPFVYMIDPITVVFSAMEGVFAYFWLEAFRAGEVTTSAIILFVGLTIEHITQGVKLGKETDEDRVLPSRREQLAREKTV